MDFKHFSISDVGRVRKANEDNCGDRMTANGYVFVVCDGMGGHVGGATASKIAVDSILDFFETPVQNIYVGISDAFKFANSQVFQAAMQDPSLKGMGTTGTILVINNEGGYIGHVGDSRIYLKSDGKLNRLTKDQSFVQNLVDQGIINDEDAENHPKKNQILEALGIKANVNPVVCDAPIKPKPGDCFLLCSDGLNGMIRDNEIEALLDPTDIENSCRALISAANEAGGKDNVTATLVAITQSPYAVSIFKHFNPVQAVPLHDTIIEPIPGDSDGGRKKTLMWVGIGVAIAAVLFVFLFFASGLFSSKDPVKPAQANENPGKPMSHQDSVCQRLEDTLEMFMSDEGVALFDSNTKYRCREDVYEKQLENGNWIDVWGDKAMEIRYGEINSKFEACDAIYNDLPKKPKKNGAPEVDTSKPKEKEREKANNPEGVTEASEDAADKESAKDTDGK